MQFRQYKNQYGLTLVELLGAISLFGIVVILSSTLIFQMLKGEDSSNNKINLNQESNVLINDLRNQYYNGNSKLCFNEDNYGIIIDVFTVSQGEKTFSINESGCIEGYNNNYPLDVKLITKSNSDKITLNTTFQQINEYVLNINNSPEENIDDFNVGDMNNNKQCVFEGNTKFNKTTLYNKKNEICKNNYIVNGSAAFLDDLTIHNKVLLEIKGNLYILGEERFKGVKGTICVYGDIMNEELLESQSINKDADSCEITKENTILLIRNNN